MTDRMWYIRTAGLFLLVMLCSASVILACFGAVTDSFTDHRLMPLFEMRDHLPVYTPPNQGPMLSTLYPPLSVLAYAPVALFHTPLPTFFFAGLLAQIFCFTPLVGGLLLSSRGGAQSKAATLLVGAAFLLWCNVSDVMNKLYLVHADDPAFLLIGSGLLLYVLHIRLKRPVLLAASAACCSLAPWAKQNAFLAIMVVPLILAVRKDSRGFALYAVTFLCMEGILLAVAHQAFDLKMLLQWLIRIPARQPWRGTAASVLEDSNKYLLHENLVAMTILGTGLLLLHAEGGRLRDWLSRPWAIFTLAGLLSWPVSVVAYVKVGGGVNSLLYSTYFINLGLALFAFEAMTDPVKPERARNALRAAVVLVALLSVPTTIATAKSVLEPSRLLNSVSLKAYEFSSRYPGEVYFPWQPLSVYFAEGKVYHFELGVCDRIAAGIAIDEVNFHRYLPPAMKYVAYRGPVPSCTLELLPEFRKPVELPELPGWVVYSR